MTCRICIHDCRQGRDCPLGNYRARRTGGPTFDHQPNPPTDKGKNTMLPNPPKAPEPMFRHRPSDTALPPETGAAMAIDGHFASALAMLAHLAAQKLARARDGRTFTVGEWILRAAGLSGVPAELMAVPPAAAKEYLSRFGLRVRGSGDDIEVCLAGESFKPMVDLFQSTPWSDGAYTQAAARIEGVTVQSLAFSGVRVRCYCFSIFAIPGLPVATEGQRELAAIGQQGGHLFRSAVFDIPPGVMRHDEWLDAMRRGDAKGARIIELEDGQFKANRRARIHSILAILFAATAFAHAAHDFGWL